MRTEDSMFNALARWHPAILVAFILFFAFVAIIGFALQFRGGEGIKLLGVGVVGLYLFGRGLYLKYEKEIKDSEERMKRLNS